jgi:hypothetical protein
VIHRSSFSLPSSDYTPRGVRRVPPYRPFRPACIGQENPRWTAPARQGHAEGGTAIGTHPRRKPWTRTNEPAVVHRSSFGEDKEGTLGSFGMSSDVEVYVEANINDEVHQSTCWKGSVCVSCLSTGKSRPFDILRTIESCASYLPHLTSLTTHGIFSNWYWCLD